jgi:transposase-like protein
MTLALLGNTLLRTAITRNLVTFPAQIQPFMKRTMGDLQERIVQLYFVRGWSVRNICDRYGMSKAMVHKLLAEWRIRAVESGYIQEIEPDCLSALDAESDNDSLENGAADNREIAGEGEPAVIERQEPVHVIYAGPIPAPIPASIPAMVPVSEGPAVLSGGRSA